MYRHVLIVLDGDPASERVLPWVRRIALAPGGVVRLLAAFPPARHSVVVGPRTIAYVDQVEAAARAAALAYLRAVAARLREDGREVVVEARVGRLVVAALEVAREQKPDLIALALREPAGLRRLWARGTVDEILGASPAPVLVVRPAGQRAA
jgi:nucleotide-binding universal stress UspA family protein